MTLRNRAALLILAVLMGSARLHAQTTMSGRVIDAANRPVPNAEVLLHAINESSGSQVDQDTSRSDGRFDLRVSSTDPKSIYFVAVTHNGQLFMGDMLRPPFPANKEYIVQVGVNPVDFGTGATAAPADTPRPQKDGNTAGVLVIVIAVGVIGSIAFVALRRRPPEHRRLLVELARLEDEIAAKPDAVLQKRRLELRERLLDQHTG